MFEADLHAHSFFSACGLHSIIEVLNAAKSKGIKAQAITDHGPHLGRHINSGFFERLHNPVSGITLLKGMECNITDQDGNIDIINNYMQWYDLVLLGLHNFDAANNSPKFYSNIIIKAIKRNPFVDIIVHPNTDTYLTDFDMLTSFAAENNVVVELNNSKLRLGRASAERTVQLIESCKSAGCYVSVSTDAHALNELADFDSIEKLLVNTNFPAKRIINRSFESTLKWIKSRKTLRANLLNNT